MRDKIRQWCVLLFSGAFAAIWCWLLLCTAASYVQSKKISVLAAALGIVLLTVMFLAKRYLRSIWQNEKLWLILSALLFLVMTAGLLYFGLSLRVYPGWDFGAVYEGAVQIAEDGRLSEQSNWYFTTYPNNITVCLLLAGIFKVFGGVCSYITIGVLLNVTLMAIGFLCFFLLVYRLYGIRTACLGLFICTLFLPFYMHAPIFYTDTFALPFVTGSFLLYQLRRRDSRFLIAAAFVLAAGYKIKGSLGVILIALLIHIWLQKRKPIECTKQSLLLLIPFLLVTGFLTILPGQLCVLDTTDAQRNEFPLEHWVAMGLEGSGGYSGDVYWMTASVEGKKEKQAVDRAFIREKLSDYGILGMLRHIKEKALFTWGDGVYFAPEKLKRDPLNESPLHPWVLYDGANYRKTYEYCSAVQLLLLGGILLSVLGNFLKKGRFREVQAMQLAVFGVFLFLLIWETRSRYLVNFVPVFVLLGLDGVQEMIRYLKGGFGEYGKET